MKSILHWLPGWFALVLLACQQAPAQQSNRPNMVLIVADDLGFGDIGCYGGDIETPNIDALARNGIRFSSFHTAPMCAPTRAMLLTGNDNHIAGMGIQDFTSDHFGYEGQLTERVVTIPQLLWDAGYHTYMAGKWHLGLTPEANPHQKGFERSFVLLEGAGNHYRNQSALEPGLSPYTEDGNPVNWPEGKYSTDVYTDRLIEYIDSNRNDNRPFFVFAAYTSPHWPLQVDEKYWKKYEGRYDTGYEKLRADRLHSLKAAGIIPEDAVLPEIHPAFANRIIPWDSLSPQQQKKEARKMELYAGMVDNLDHNIGRLLTYLKETGQFENTLFVFMSDNGAAHRDFLHHENYTFLKDYYNDDYENMGKADSYISYGPAWAEAGSSPFRYFKDYATEGGINTTLILSGPGVRIEKEVLHGFLTLQDLAPTFYDLAGITYPERYNGNPVYPLRGTSLLPFLSGNSETIHRQDDVFAMEHIGHAMLRKGNWKIVNVQRPLDIKNFELYNLAEDLQEKHNLKDAAPDKYRELLAHWNTFAEEIKLQSPPPFKKSK
ncbi:arylsulfatase [Robertkochia flava]|uniref:arylsulfatase n=1 Tax=Robertkochia flava TaxID=3447986 RepID=UPI001CC99CCB|nr:arylsulfatase [Robertkochia marina]